MADRPRGVRSRALALQAARKQAQTRGSQAAINSMGRMRLLRSMAGIQYAGKRDVYQAAGYIPQDQDKFEDYWGLYQRGDVAGRIVDMPVKTTWKTPPEISEPDHEDGTPFTEKFTELAKRLRLWHYFERLDRLAGIGRYGVMMLGIKGADDIQLQEPLERVRRPEDLIYLSVYHERFAQIDKWQMDVQHPRFGLPEMYKLYITTNQFDPNWTRSVSITVHHSRCIHAAEDLLQDEVFGRPRLQRALNRLFDLDKISAATGESYWQLMSRILQAKVDPEYDIQEEELEALDEKMLEMTHDLRRQFTGRGVNLEWLNSTAVDVSGTADFYFSLLAGATGIPKRILFGSEQGQLASTQDQVAYYGLINERQEHFAEPHILRRFIDRMIEIGILPKPTTGEYIVTWPTMFEESDKDQAEADLKRAEAAKALTPIGGNPLDVVEIDDDRHVWLVPKAPGPVIPAEEEEEEEEGSPDESEDIGEGSVSGEPNPADEPGSSKRTGRSKIPDDTARRNAERGDESA